LDVGESVKIWMMKGLCGEGFTYGEGIYLWRGDLSPFGGEAVVIHWTRYGWKKQGLLRSPTGINPLATGKPYSHRQVQQQ
jgi:hypothetical protein